MYLINVIYKFTPHCCMVTISFYALTMTSYVSPFVYIILFLLCLMSAAENQLCIYNYMTYKAYILGRSQGCSWCVVPI